MLSKFPPIFIVGCPRSGSTLAIQLITQTFSLGYISNLHCQNFTKIGNFSSQKLASANEMSDFRSFHGKTNGDLGPSECPDWWYQFFRKKPTHVTLNDICHAKMNKFRGAVESFTKETKRTIVFKNLFASLRLLAICKYLPECLLIKMSRNEIDTCHSLLEARFKKMVIIKTGFPLNHPISPM